TGMRECAQVGFQRTGVRRVVEPLAQSGRIAGRQLPAPRIPCQLDHGLRAEPAVELVVQPHLWSAPERFRAQPCSRLHTVHITQHLGTFGRCRGCSPTRWPHPPRSHYITPRITLSVLFCPLFPTAAAVLLRSTLP